MNTRYMRGKGIFLHFHYNYFFSSLEARVGMLWEARKDARS